MIEGVLVDNLGNAIANATINYKVNGVESTVITDANGSFAFNVSEKC